MHVPFLTSCGHSFCYECLLSWFGNKLNCPTCRQDLEQPPILNVQLRDISRNLTDVIISAGDAKVGAELAQARSAANAEFLRATKSNSLVGDVFLRAVTLIDKSDGVPRCGNCHWEAHGSVCLHCGTRFRIPMDDDYYDSENGDAYDEDDEEALRAQTGNGYDLDDSFIDERDVVEIEVDLDNDDGHILSTDEEAWDGFSSPSHRADPPESDNENLDDALSRFNDDVVEIEVGSESSVSPVRLSSDDEVLSEPKRARATRDGSERRSRSRARRLQIDDDSE